MTTRQMSLDEVLQKTQVFFLLKKGTKSNICHRLSNDRCDLARRQSTVLNNCWLSQKIDKAPQYPPRKLWQTTLSRLRSINSRFSKSLLRIKSKYWEAFSMYMYKAGVILLRGSFFFMCNKQKLIPWSFFFKNNQFFFMKNDPRSLFCRGHYYSLHRLGKWSCTTHRRCQSEVKSGS